MGSTRSRPRLRKVAPCNSLQKEGAQPKPQWTLPALQVTVDQPLGSLGQRKTTLPPLKQEITLSTLSEPCFAGNFPPKQSDNSSIIHSHPPRRPQALQPLALQIGQTSTANQIAMGRDRGVQRFSTIGQTGHCGTSRMIQEGFLEAQTALTQQTHRHRRVHLRQAREQRRQKVFYTVNEGIQRVNLVRRPTERNIFWDETTREYLDPSCLLDPKSLPHLCKERLHNQPDKQLPCRGDIRIQAQGRTQRIELNKGDCLLDKNLAGTNEREIVSVEDRRKTQTDSWMWPESARGCHTGRIRGARGIWDYKMD